MLFGVGNSGHVAVIVPVRKGCEEDGELLERRRVLSLRLSD
jgi:hypothetical protein